LSDDAELMIRVQGGDEAALGALMERWELPVKSLVGRIVLNASEAEELAQEAVVRVLDGDRTWDPTKVDLVFFLKEVMRSILNADLKSPAAAKDSLNGDQANESGTAGSGADERLGVLDDRDRGLARSAEQQLLESEKCAAIVDRALDAAGTDPVLGKLVNAIVEGCSKSAEIAQATGLSVDQVYEATRKLRRRLSARGSRS